MSALEEMTVEELEEAAQGCTELTCLYHGPVNFELRERRLRAQAKTD